MYNDPHHQEPDQIPVPDDLNDSTQQPISYDPSDDVMVTGNDPSFEIDYDEASANPISISSGSVDEANNISPNPAFSGSTEIDYGGDSMSYSSPEQILTPNPTSGFTAPVPEVLESIAPGDIEVGSEVTFSQGIDPQPLSVSSSVGRDHTPENANMTSPLGIETHENASVANAQNEETSLGQHVEQQFTEEPETDESILTPNNANLSNHTGIETYESATRVGEELAQINYGQNVSQQTERAGEGDILTPDNANFANPNGTETYESATSVVEELSGMPSSDGSIDYSIEGGYAALNSDTGTTEQNTTSSDANYSDARGFEVHVNDGDTYYAQNVQIENNGIDATQKVEETDSQPQANRYAQTRINDDLISDIDVKVSFVLFLNDIQSSHSLLPSNFLRSLTDVVTFTYGGNRGRSNYYHYTDEANNEVHTIQLTDDRRLFIAEDQRTLPPMPYVIPDRLHGHGFLPVFLANRLQALYHECTHAYLDINKNSPELEGFIRAGELFFAGVILNNGRVVQEGFESGMVFREAVSTYVGNTVAALYYAEGAIISLFNSVDSGAITDMEVLNNRLNEVRSRYDQVLDQQFYGYMKELDGRQIEIDPNNVRNQRYRLSQEMRTFINEHFLENKIPDRFDDIAAFNQLIAIMRNKLRTNH